MISGFQPRCEARRWPRRFLLDSSSSLFFCSLVVTVVAVVVVVVVVATDLGGMEGKEFEI